MHRENGYKDDSRTSKGGIVKEATRTTHIKQSAFWKLSEKRTIQRNRYLCSTESDNRKRVRGDAVDDSVAVECVTCRKRMPHLRVEETPESRRGETWTGAGGNEIKKEGKVTVNWQIDVGHHEARCIQSRTSVKNIDQCGQTSGNRS